MSLVTEVRRTVGGVSPRRQPSDGYLRAVVRAVIRRLALSIPLLFLVSALTFILTSLSPGNAAREILGIQATPATYERLREAMGLNLPVWDQYWRWLRAALHGNLGTSVLSGQSVSLAIRQHLPVTLSLMIGALVVTTVLGVAIGMVTALRGGFVAKTVEVLALVGFALPGFWLASELIVLFAVQFHWFPAEGYVAISQSPVAWIKSITLPVVALSLASIALVAKQTRESMSRVLGSEFVRMARAHGVSPTSLILRYALRNACAPVVTIIGIQAVTLLAGTLFVENVFALPGLGSLLVTSALDHDLPVVEGITVLFTAFVVVVNLVVDLVYSWVDPKVRVR